MKKVVIVTGANGGIGKNYCREMLRHNYHVVMAVRSKSSGEKVLKELVAEFPTGSIELLLVDMSSLTSIEKFAKDFKVKHQRLDVLAHNAGVYFFDKERKMSSDGIELNFAIHYVGPYALTVHLFDILTNTQGAKIITVSSSEHRGNPIDENDIQLEHNFEKYGNMIAYSRSKWASISFSYMLAKYIEEHDLAMDALSVHPGVSITGIQHKGNPTFFQKAAIWLFGKLIAGKPEDAALPLVMASLKGKNREFYGPTGFKEAKGKPGLVKADPTTNDMNIGTLLWKKTEELTHLRFPR